MTLYFMKYNNYYNRIIKKLETITAYGEAYNPVIKEGINFNPNDNINTQLTVNWDYDWEPDYVLVQDPVSGKFTRWFIISSTRLRGKQYQMLLRHDLVADNLDSILDADCFIEKAILNSTDPFIYNSENITFNQIKQPETELIDETGCAWIVGYFNPDESLKNKVIDADKTNVFDISVNESFESWKSNLNIKSNNDIYYTVNPNRASIAMAYSYTGSSEIYGTKFAGYYTKSNYDSKEAGGSSAVNTIKVFLEERGHVNKIYDLYVADGIASKNKVKDYSGIHSRLATHWDTYINSYIETQLVNGLTSNQINRLLVYNNKIVRFTENNNTYSYKYITFSLKSNSSSSYKSELLAPNIATQIVTNDVLLSNGSKGYPSINTGKLVEYSLNIKDVDNALYTTTFPPEFLELVDAPYSMFCIPYNKDNVDRSMYIQDGTTSYKIDTSAGFRLAQKIATELGGGTQTSFIYDLQLLPYCPVRRIVNYSDGTFIGLTLNNEKFIDTPSGNVPKSYCPIKVGGNIVSYIFFAEKSEFTLNIPIKRNIENKKIESQTDFYRLVSPNYNGQFEFNLAKNNGLNYINVDCTYKPYNPYIHLNPDFGELYGSDYNDSRGLICNGDFSLTILSDAWTNYQIQNKNYQNIFDREIQSLELGHKFERRNDIISGITGMIQGGISGGMSGASGGAPGVIAGAVVGTATSAFGFGLDYQMKEALRTDALDYKNDMFGYHLENIQALPQSISKTTPFTYNNKIFPILEYYTCTDEEKEAFAKKIAYNSMTVMRIGKLRDYAKNSWSYKNIQSKGYIKGSIIKLDNLYEDFHVINAISDEIYKGVYLQ